MVIWLKRAILIFSITFAFESCAVQKGCPATRANIGAEKILSGDPKASKDLNKSKKYTLNKF